MSSAKQHENNTAANSHSPAEPCMLEIVGTRLYNDRGSFSFYFWFLVHVEINKDHPHENRQKLFIHSLP
jgi:hypothetical protein